MRMHMNPLRGALVLLLAVSATLFLVGSTVERSTSHREPAQATAAAGGETGGETGGEASPHEAGHSASSEVGTTVLGIDTESVGLSVAAVLLSTALAVAVAAGRRKRLVLFAVLGFGLVFAAADARELVHQLDESNSGLAAVAAILLVLHLATAVLAAALLRGGQRPTRLTEAAS
jgi:hypothetical protein